VKAGKGTILIEVKKVLRLKKEIENIVGRIKSQLKKIIMSKVEKRNFRIKMHEACSADELRPILCCVHFDNGYMVATNAHVLIKARLDQFTPFEPEEISMLNGKFFDRETFKKVFACKQVKVVEEGIEDLSNGTLYKFFKVDGKYPNYQAVIPTDMKQLSEISLDPKVAKKLFSILAYDDNKIVMTFSGANRAIKIHSTYEHEDSLTAILMPVAI
jgi:DNA polymerase III sliding clamp (beta) subunit (PCNA family)